jgi:hypothetical protein
MLLGTDDEPASQRNVLGTALVYDQSPRNKGERMRFTRMMALLVGLVAFGGFALSASALEFDQLTIRVPYDFVVSGKTLPAGTYRLSRVDTPFDRELLLKNEDNASAVLIIPDQTDEARGGKLDVTFQQIGGVHFLSRIETPEHVFGIPISKSEILHATNKPNQPSKASTTTGD